MYVCEAGASIFFFNGVFTQERGARKMDLVPTLKLFVQQHLECIGHVRSAETPRHALNIKRSKDLQLDGGGLSSNCSMLCLHVLLLD